jgi:hypothetical protein
MKQFHRTLAAGAAVLVIAGSAVGIAQAQATPTPQTPGTQQQQTRPDPQAFLDALARRLNVSSQALQTAIGQARTDVGLPADGGFPFGRGGHGRGGPRGGGFELDTAAQAIGITADQLRQELPGKSLAQVAQAHGKTANDVGTALKNAAHQRIDQEVANGRIQAADAAARKTQVDQRIDQLVNEVKPPAQGAPRGPGNRGPGGATAPAA